jgi:hypothetical protein
MRMSLRWSNPQREYPRRKYSQESAAVVGEPTTYRRLGVRLIVEQGGRTFEKQDRVVTESLLYTL